MSKIPRNSGVTPTPTAAVVIEDDMRKMCYLLFPAYYSLQDITDALKTRKPSLMRHS